MNVDALEVTFTASEEVKERLRSLEVGGLFGRVLLRRERERNYHQEFVIMWKGRYWGWMYFDTPNKFRGDVYIRVNNEVFYDRGLFADRFVIAEALGLEFKRVSKLDVCCDFNFRVQPWLWKAYKNEDYGLIINGIEHQGKYFDSVGGSAFGGTRQRPFLFHEFLAVNDRRTLTMKCYDKAREIERKGKGYIAASNGFRGRSMWRVEMSCKDYKHLRPTLKALRLSDEKLYKGLDDGRVLALVFCSFMNRVLRLKKGRKSYNLLSVAFKDLEIRDLSA